MRSALRTLFTLYQAVRARVRVLALRALGRLFPKERRDFLCALLENEEGRAAEAAAPRLPRQHPFLQWDVATETGEFTNIFKLSLKKTLSAADVQEMRDS